ncbi:MAG: integrase core domain-containing protein [candidate division Zixibacteria bacterium]|nr:integrase core domain-containing protein [candidate division Zixibacteria bacterium]
MFSHRSYGLPEAIRSDNGPPFATTTVGGLSLISIWLLRLGIIPERIAPGVPAQNGRHERMHRTLKAQTASPPKATLRAQQRAFDAFRHEYNNDRPHEGIGQKTPQSLFALSRRTYPSRLPEIKYPDHFLVRTVHGQGDLRWKSRQIYLSATLAGQHIGMEETETDRWTIWFGPIRLAVLDTKTYCLRHYPRRWRHRKER